MKKLDDFSLKELSGIVASCGEPSFRAKQLYYWLYKAGASSYDEMTNLSSKFKDQLSADFALTSLHEVKRTTSGDGSIKFLFRLEDGENIECVLLKDGDRISGCVSTQVGCRMGCKFCATAGAVGFKRNLTSGEILKQVFIMRRTAEDLFEDRLLNLVFMGMGEPLDNVTNLTKALTILLDEDAFGFSHRKITVSTAGVIDGIAELFKMETPVNIAVSINAPTQEQRKELMPIANKYPLDQLVETLKKLELDKRKRVTIEYVMLKGINDSVRDAQSLVKLLRGVKAKINLIIYNESTFSKYKAPSMDTVLKFQNLLIKNDLAAFIRKRLGSDIAGACGQLAAEYAGAKA